MAQAPERKLFLGVRLRRLRREDSVSLSDRDDNVIL